MTAAITRTDKWKLTPSLKQVKLLTLTVNVYRTYVRALIGVIHVHYPEIISGDSQCAAVEQLIHHTAKNPNPRYSYFDRKFPMFPSYLRRAAIENALGQVSSFLTRYHKWQLGHRGKRTDAPPRLNAITGVYPSLYKGQCIKFDEGLEIAQIKVFDGKAWDWIKVPITTKRNRHTILGNRQRSPMLIVKDGKAHLSVPFIFNPPKLPATAKKVCAVDLGINTAATASIVSSDGTVTARKFINLGADIDRRDKRLKLLSRKASLTMHKKGKLHKGFCRSLYRKAGNINKHIAQTVSTQLVRWAKENQADVIVFENLKGWRPKGGKKKSTLRQRFHGWLHRRIAELTEQKFVELGGFVEYVPPRGTSKYAFDGSGLLSRSTTNYALATFCNGKRYNADLSASYNIGARYWAYKLKLAYRNGRQSVSGRSSQTEPRMPVCLSTLWVGSQKPRLQSVRV